MRNQIFRSLCGLLALISILVGCEAEIQDGNTDSINGGLDPEVYSKLIEIYRQRPDDEVVFLLSIKYTVPSDDVRLIIDKYLQTHDRSYALRKAMLYKATEGDLYSDDIMANLLPAKEMLSTVGQLSAEYNLEEKLIAGIILEYRKAIWAKEASEIYCE